MRPPENSAVNAADLGDACDHEIRLAHHLAYAKTPCEYSPMSRELINELCAALLGAEWSDPWGGGHDCWKVGGKIFALVGAMGDDVAVKTTSPETAEFLIETGIAKPAKYMHRSWIELPADSAPDELAHRIRTSYAIIHDALPKRVRDGIRME